MFNRLSIAATILALILCAIATGCNSQSATSADAAKLPSTSQRVDQLQNTNMPDAAKAAVASHLQNQPAQQ